MLSAFHCLALQLPWIQAGQLLLVTAISFGALTLICSIVRFHQMIQQDEEQLISTGDCNDFFYIQVTRYLSKINRGPDGFGILMIQFECAEELARPTRERLLQRVQRELRKKCDRACLYRTDCIAAIIDAREELLPTVARRITTALQTAAQSNPPISGLRAATCHFPTHGHGAQQLIQAAESALEQAPFASDSHAVATAPRPDAAPEESEKESSSELGKIDAHASLDALTGVLKPKVIASYMRKYLAELRQKKEPAALLSVGINRIEHISDLHGAEAADAVIAGVSKRLKELTRDSDLIGRFQREDFLILAPCTVKQGEQIAIRLHDAIRKEVFTHDGKRIKTSISVGISGHPEHGRTLRDLFKASHTALSTVRNWNTSACLIYNSTSQPPKKTHEPVLETRR